MHAKSVVRMVDKVDLEQLLFEEKALSGSTLLLKTFACFTVTVVFVLFQVVHLHCI